MKKAIVSLFAVLFVASLVGCGGLGGSGTPGIEKHSPIDIPSYSAAVYKCSDWHVAVCQRKLGQTSFTSARNHCVTILEGYWTGKSRDLGETRVPLQCKGDSMPSAEFEKANGQWTFWYLSYNSETGQLDRR